MLFHTTAHSAVLFLLLSFGGTNVALFFHLPFSAFAPLLRIFFLKERERSMATEVLTTLATTLYDAVQTAKGNMEQCDAIGERVTRLLPTLQSISSRRASSAVRSFNL